tara:strand:+ start:342 stop:1184 length:843 start_codon:yes stop_codon:yes gene_type:complete
MTDKIVDSDLSNLGEIDTSSLTSQLEAEKTTSDSEESISTVEDVAEQTVPDTTVPPKFQGKSVDEILESYSNLEKQYGKQGNELGELRKLADTLIQKNLQESQTTRAQTQEEALSDDDFLTNPIDSVRRIVEESLQPIKGALSQTATETTISRLQAKHPDLETLVQDIDFQKWVMESVPRQEMWQKASAGDFNYADELFSQYKTLYGAKQQAVQQKVQTEKEKELQAATAVASGASPDAVSTGKPTYRRSELIRLQLEDPKRYADLQPEIYQAYSEGRVR